MENICPYCGKVNDAFTPAEKNYKEKDKIPSPGAIAICAYCTGVCELNSDMKFIKPNLEELEKKHPGLIGRIERAKSALRSTFLPKTSQN